MAMGPLGQVTEFAVIIGVTVTAVEGDLEAALPLLWIRNCIPNACPGEVKVIHVGPPDQAIGALDIVAGDIRVNLFVIFGAHQNDRRSHVIGTWRRAIELVIGVKAHVPTERPRAIVVIRDHNVAAPHRALADRIDLIERPFDIGGSMGVDQVFGRHVKVDIVEHIGEADCQDQEQRCQPHKEQAQCRLPPNCFAPAPDQVA